MPNIRCRVWTQCLNCKKRFSINNAEYLKRMEKTRLDGLFCRKLCMDEYHNQHRNAQGMKNRILAINKKAQGAT